MANDSNVTLISAEFSPSDASKEVTKDQVSLKQDDGISVRSGGSTSSGEKKKELHAEKEIREEMSRNRSLPADENQAALSKREVPPVKNTGMSVPVLVVPAPSLQTVSSSDSFQSLGKPSEFSMEKVLGQATTSLLNEAELEASKLMKEETSHAATEDDAPGKLHSLMNCRICQLFVRTVDRLLDKSEEAMDRYMPLTEEEISSLKQAVAELDTSSEDHQKSACLDRITALSSRLRQRAYMMALGKLRLARRSTHSNLSQLQLTIDLIEHAQQEAEPECKKSHEKLNEMCSQWSQQKQSMGELPPYKPEEVPATSSGPAEARTPLPVPLHSTVEAEMPQDEPMTEAGISAPAERRGTMETGVLSARDLSSDEALMIYTVPGCREENGFPSTQVEAKTLEMSRTLTLDLQGTYKNLLANLKDLPLNLKQKLHQTYQHMTELHTRFTTAHRFADLPGSFLTKGLEFMVQAQQLMDEVMEFAFQHPMGMWTEEQPPAPVTTETPVSTETPVTTETPSTRQEVEEEGDILKIQAAYDPKGCDENQK